MNRFFRLVLIFAVSILLSACGAGGDESSTTLSVSPSSVSFNADFNGASPASQELNISWSGADVYEILAGYPPGVAEPSWLNAEFSGSSASSILLSVTNTALTAGTYSTTLRVVSADRQGYLLKQIDIPITYVVAPALGVAVSSFDVSYAIGSEMPGDLSFLVTGNGINWTIESDQNWLSFNTASGIGDAWITVSADLSGLGAGNHVANITVHDAEHNATFTIPYNVSITEPAFVIVNQTLNFSGINGTTIPATGSASVNLSVNNNDAITWSAVVSDSWIVLDKSTGTTADVFTASIDASTGALASGDYSGTISLTGSSNGYLLQATIDVNLSLTKPELTLSASSVLIGGSDGLDTQSQSFSFALNTGANDFAWNAVLDSGVGLNWLQSDKLTGNVSVTQDTVMLSADSTGLTGNTYSGSVTLNVVVNGDTVTSSVPVTYNLEANKLFVADNGVAFASMPNYSQLSKTVKVIHTNGGVVSWSATSDQSWLAVTAGGTTDGDLVLTADPSGLTANSFYSAVVTITSSDPVIENTEIISVGLWVGSADPAAASSVAITALHVVADPVRPYVYVNNNGTAVDVYHVHSGALLTSINSVAAQAGEMIISSDGSKLFVADNTNYQVVPVSLPDNTVETPWDTTLLSMSNFRMAYSRPRGYEVILIGGGKVFDVSAGSLIADTTPFYSGNIAASLNGKTFYTQGLGSSGHALNGYAIDYTALNSGELIISLVKASTESGFAADLAVSDDGAKVYSATGSPYNFRAYDGTTLLSVQTLPGDAYPNNVEVGPYGLFYGAIQSWYGPFDAWIYNDAGIEQRSFYLSDYAKAIRSRQHVVSGDGLMMISSTDTPSLLFTRIQP